MQGTILALNAGSSSLKYALYRMDEGVETEFLSGTLKTASDSPSAVLELISEQMRAKGVDEPSLVGHRLVHGGPSFTSAVAVDQGVLERLDQLVPLAPLHLPPALSLLRAALERYPRARHVACFDTAFHRTLPEVARRFALPSELYERGVRRYGFHGLSYEYVLSVLGSRPPARLIVAHLGGGASVAAIQNGRCIDTSMGLTPCGGVPMGTRSGDLDPGVVVYLLRELGYTADSLEHLVNHASGLLGVAGDSHMSELLSRATAGDASAHSALTLFGYAVKKQLGAYVAALGGVDCLVFTGGIGEHAPLVRELACGGLEGLGIELDRALNAENAPRISRSSSPCVIRVVSTNENLLIARQSHALQRKGNPA